MRSVASAVAGLGSRSLSDLGIRLGVPHRPSGHLRLNLGKLVQPKSPERWSDRRSAMDLQGYRLTQTVRLRPGGSLTGLAIDLAEAAGALRSRDRDGKIQRPDSAASLPEVPNPHRRTSGRPLSDSADDGGRATPPALQGFSEETDGTSPNRQSIMKLPCSSR